MVRLRVGLIGTGFWARTVHAAGVQRNPRTELVGVWGRVPSKSRELAAQLGTRAYTEVAALLAEVDALTFAVPPDVQSEIALQAVEAGRHVLLEKPVATSTGSAERLEAAISQARIASIVFFTRRFVPETIAWLEATRAQGEFDGGRAESLSAALVDGGPFSASPWRHDRGALWDIGPHVLSMLCPILGDVTSVVAGGGRGDQVHLVMRHANGASSTASVSLTVPPPVAGSMLYVYGPAGRSTAPGATVDTVAAHSAALDALIGQTERPGSGHPCDVHFGRRVVQILAAAEQSLQTGATVPVR